MIHRRRGNLRDPFWSGFFAGAIVGGLVGVLFGTEVGRSARRRLELAVDDVRGRFNGRGATSPELEVHETSAQEERPS